MSQQLIYILLGIAIIAFAIITIRDWTGQKKVKEQNMQDSNASIRSIALPLQLQAYERLAMLLERINPENLVSRVVESNMDVQDVRSLMIHSIRSEYDHNVSQQIYVSTDAWEAVSNAKEQLISLINSIANKMDTESDGKSLAKQLLELSLKEDDLPAKTALVVVNAEAKKLMADHNK